jgi:hypothetical protein
LTYSGWAADEPAPLISVAEAAQVMKKMNRVARSFSNEGMWGRICGNAI